MDDREMYNALTDEQQKIIINIMKMMLEGMGISEVINRLRFTKTLYEKEIIKMLSERSIPEAKRDIKALEIAIALLEERSEYINAGS